MQTLVTKSFMKKTLITLSAALWVLPVTAKEAPPVTAKEISSLASEGFEPLFKEDSLDGFSVKGGQADFSIKDGVLMGHATDLPKNSFLSTDKTYRNFVFAFQFKFDTLKGNSGVMFRAQQKGKDDQKNPGRVFGYQCEHDNNMGRAWTAGLYDEGRRKWLFPFREDRKVKKKDPKFKKAQKAFTKQGQRLFKKDDWNTIVVKCVDEKVQTWLNGELRVDYMEKDEEIAKQGGFFGFQVHGGKACDVRWKNIFVKEL